MTRYLETAKQLHGAIGRLATRLNMTNDDVAELGLIANLAVRCCPRACQSTVRKNIITEAVKGYCNVSMNLVTDEVTKKSFNAISITPIGLKTAISETADSAGDESE